MNPTFIEVAIGSLAAISLSLVGWSLGGLVAPGSRPLVRLAPAFPIGGAFVSWLMYSASLLRLPLTTGVVAVGLVLLTSLSILSMKLPRRIPSIASGGEEPIEHFPPAIGKFLFLLGALALFAIVLRLALERGYSTWDAMAIWSIKGYGIAREGTVMAAARWGSHGLAYPLNIPIHIALFRLLTTDLVPISKIIFPLFYISLLVGSFAWLSERHDWTWASAGALVIGTLPIIFQHGTLGYANLPFTAYLALGTLSLISWQERGGRGDLWLGAFLLAGASWTRAEGLYLVPLVWLSVLTVHRALAGEWLNPGWSVVPFALAMILWQPVAASSPSTSTFMRAIPQAIKGWLHLDVHLSALYWIARFAARQAVEPSVWAVMMPLIGVLLVLARKHLSPRQQPSAFALLCSAGVVGAWGVAYFYLSSYPFDVTYLLGTSVNRVFMPFWILLLLAALSLNLGEASSS